MTVFNLHQLTPILPFLALALGMKGCFILFMQMGIGCALPWVYAWGGWVIAVCWFLFLYEPRGPRSCFFLTCSIWFWMSGLFDECRFPALQLAFFSVPGMCLNCCSILYPLWWLCSTQCSISLRSRPGWSRRYCATEWYWATCVLGVLLSTKSGWHFTASSA